MFPFDDVIMDQHQLNGACVISKNKIYSRNKIRRLNDDEIVRLFNALTSTQNDGDIKHDIFKYIFHGNYLIRD